MSTAGIDRFVSLVNRHADELCNCDSDQLQQRFAEIRRQKPELTANGTSAEAIAIIREAASRTVLMRPYDVQLQAAFAMHRGHCVEMQTGEGKTLAAAVLVCLRALSGQDVHVLTFNSYLAERDANWMRPLYQFLGLTVGAVVEGMSPVQRRQAYACDVTYITAKEAGFDYLRDQLCERPEDRVQRGHGLAIVDEADSILIDEARVPLVIATEAEVDNADLTELARMVQQMRDGFDFIVKADRRNISFTDSGIAKLERQLAVTPLYSEQNAGMLARLNVALQAEHLLHQNVDYIVRDNRIELIDEFTGRVAENRKWPGGLQAALEAKEGVPIQPQGRILNSITLQHYLELYEELAGMTGTAIDAAEELADFYRLTVTVITPNRPCIRIDQPDKIFVTKQEKCTAVVEEICRQHRQQRPVLVGTASVEESETLAQHLHSLGLPCRVLNAANDHLEADIISEAGARGAITISTNMAGRGTDIRPGGSQGYDRHFVNSVGGLYVIGTNRHESRRIDNQLRGRTGRQGEPGETQFFISLEDDLICHREIRDAVTIRDTIGNGNINVEQTARQIAHLQRVIEGECYEIRRTLRVYAHLLEVQRRIIAENRNDLLTRRKKPSAMRKHAPELRAQLVQRWGEQVVNEAECRVALAHIDWLWSDHLAHAAEIRESIHLASFGGFNAYDVFNNQMKNEFQSFLELVEQKVVDTMSSAEITADGINLQREGVSGPSSTWTFMINDNPRGAVLSQLLRGIVRRLTPSGNS